MQVALCCPDGLMGDALEALIQSRPNLIFAGRASNLRSCVNHAKQSGADVILVQADKVDRQDLQFLSGAKTFGDFRTILIGSIEGIKGDPAFDQEVPLNTKAAKLFEVIDGFREDLKKRGGRMVRETRRDYGGTRMTKREYDVAQLVAQGLSNRRISEVTGLKEQSVKNLVSAIMRKMHCGNRVQVALKLRGHTPGT